MTEKVVAAAVSPLALARIVIDPAPVPVTAFDASPDDDATVAGSPLTVPEPEILANVTE